MSLDKSNMNPGFNYTALGNLINEKFGRNEFAKLMSINKNRLDSMLLSKCEFTQTEIIRAAALLGISANDVAYYFFNKKV